MITLCIGLFRKSFSLSLTNQMFQFKKIKTSRNSKVFCIKSRFYSIKNQIFLRSSRDPNKTYSTGCSENLQIVVG